VALGFQVPELNGGFDDFARVVELAEDTHGNDSTRHGDVKAESGGRRLLEVSGRLSCMCGLKRFVW